MESKKILRVSLVDDSRAVLESLTALISEIEGVEIVGCTQDARLAQDAIRLLKPDVLVLDIRMPEQSGLSIIKAIRQDGQSSPVIIVVSNEADQAHRRVCLKLGADY